MIKLLQTARPQFLISRLALFVFGAAWAILLGASFSLSRILFGYLVLMPAHLSISYSNDYFDVGVDKYDKPTFFSGGSGILVNHPGWWMDMWFLWSSDRCYNKSRFSFVW